MSGIPTTISARISDGYGDTCREDIDILVDSAGCITVVSGDVISAFDLQREGNRENIARAKWQAKLHVAQSKLLLIRSGFISATPKMRIYMEGRLTRIVSRIQKGIAKIKRMKKVGI